MANDKVFSAKRLGSDYCERVVTEADYLELSALLDIKSAEIMDLSNRLIAVQSQSGKPQGPGTGDERS